MIKFSCKNRLFRAGLILSQLPRSFVFLSAARKTQSIKPEVTAVHCLFQRMHAEFLRAYVMCKVAAFWKTLLFARLLHFFLVLTEHVGC